MFSLPPLQVELPVDTVMERGLVSEKVKWKDVVNNHQAYSQAHVKTPKFSGGPVLGYVTPVSHVCGVAFSPDMGDSDSSLPFTNLMGGPHLKQQFACRLHLCACTYTYMYIMVYVHNGMHM